MSPLRFPWTISETPHRFLFSPKDTEIFCSCTLESEIGGKMAESTKCSKRTQNWCSFFFIFWQEVGRVWRGSGGVGGGGSFWLIL